MSINEKIFILILYQELYLGSSAQQWFFPSQIQALKGSCVEIPCTFANIRNVNPSVVWYHLSRNPFLQILNSKDSSAVHPDYKGRTFLVKTAIISCTLRINRVTNEDSGKYFPGTDGKQINSYEIQGKMITLLIADVPNNLKLVGPGKMTEGHPVLISCSAIHTCPSFPPTFTWNRDGQLLRLRHEYRGEGIWESISQLTYHPTNVDNGKEIQCKAVYPNLYITQQGGTLNIELPPKNTHIVLSKKVIMEGDDVTLSCSSKSNPSSNLFGWYNGMRKITLSDKLSWIIIGNVSWNNEPYTCTATNKLGRGESAPLEIPVQYAAKGVRLIINEENEDYIELKCEYLISRPNVSHYLWIRDTIILTNQTLQVLKLEKIETNSGEYQCVAVNSIGSSYSSHELITAQSETSTVNLYWIVGCLAAVIVLIFVMLVVYFCMRLKKGKSVLPAAPINEFLPKSMLHHTSSYSTQHATNPEYVSMDEHLYGNTENEKIKHTNFIRSHSSKRDLHHFQEDNAIYSNVEYDYPGDLHYSSIQHDPSNDSPRTIKERETTTYAVISQS